MFWWPKTLSTRFCFKHSTMPWSKCTPTSSCQILTPHLESRFFTAPFNLEEDQPAGGEGKRGVLDCNYFLLLRHLVGTVSKRWSVSNARQLWLLIHICKLVFRLDHAAQWGTSYYIGGEPSLAETEIPYMLNSPGLFITTFRASYSSYNHKIWCWRNSRWRHSLTRCCQFQLKVCVSSFTFTCVSNIHTHPQQAIGYCEQVLTMTTNRIVMRIVYSNCSIKLRVVLFIANNNNCIA